MALCTTLQSRVLNLEKTKTTQQNDIDSLKRKVKKLKKKRSLRTHKVKRLYKVGLSARVESFGDEKILGEDASKQGRRINAIDSDEDITLVNVQDDVDNKMFDVDALNGEESIPSEDPYEEAVRQLLEQAPRPSEYVPDPKELEDHVPVYIPEPKHPEDLVPAKDEAPIEPYITEVASAPTPPLPPPSLLPTLI
ncbi:hypothetical protein Tco_0415186 [Tanacetum coccineum]